jgi:hypothetical protein
VHRTLGARGKPEVILLQPLSLRFNQNRLPSHRISGRFCDGRWGEEVRRLF